VFLNLVKNSERALARMPQPVLSIRATEFQDSVAVSVTDNGEGIVHPELLFRPFQPSAKGSGLGLCLSRALMRSFHGELDYQPSPAGATFILRLSRFRS